MKNKSILFLLIGHFLISFLFPEQKKILWDLGVIINAPIQNVQTENEPVALKNKLNENYNYKALVSDLFIPPTIISNDNAIINPQMKLNYNGVKKINDITKIKLIVAQLSLKTMYQPIIEMINKLDLNNLEDDDHAELNYWLANALLNTGQYSEAENILLDNSYFMMNDKTNFLLATIFERQNKLDRAQKEYLKFIDNFPDSDYKMAALIKARMLSRH